MTTNFDISTFEDKIIFSQNDPQVIFDAKKKIEKLRTWMMANKFDSVLISRRDNFAWLTIGGDNHVVLNTEIGTGHLLITPDNQYLLAYTMDGARLMEEQTADQGYELVTARWYEADPRQLSSTLGGKRIAADAQFPGFIDCSLEIGLLRDPLTEIELNRIKWLAYQTGAILEMSAMEIQPGMSELDIKCLLNGNFLSKGIELDVLLIGSDERAVNYRHYIPTHKILEKYLLVNPSARKWGLHANVSRSMNFGLLDDVIKKNHEIASAIVAKMLGGLSPGKLFSDVLEIEKNAFSKFGLTGNWQDHFPGGVTGYPIAECYSLSETRIVQNQAFDWFITLPGVMVEELAILTSSGMEIPSLGREWPVCQYQVLDQRIEIPTILVL